METLTTLTAKKSFIKDNLDKLSDESRPTLSQINAFKAEDLALVDELVTEINSFVAPTEEETVTEPVEKVSDLKYEILVTDSGAQVEVVWLPYIKYNLRNGKANYQFQFGDNMITLQNALLKPLRKELVAGSLFPIKVETIKPIVAERTYGYGKTVYNGQIAEFACEILQDARTLQLEEEEERADMSEQAVALADKMIAEAQAKAYLLKKGIKI